MRRSRIKLVPNLNLNGGASGCNRNIISKKEIHSSFSIKDQNVETVLNADNSSETIKPSETSIPCHKLVEPSKPQVILRDEELDLPHSPVVTKSVQDSAGIDDGHLSVLVNDTTSNKLQFENAMPMAKPKSIDFVPVSSSLDQFQLKRHNRYTKGRRKMFNQNEPPDRSSITMFDFIYYNPRGSKPSKKESNEVILSHGDKNGAVPSLTEEDDDDDDNVPAPQVKVGPDGQIILDMDSTFIETTASKKAKIDILATDLILDDGNKATNHGSWRKRKYVKEWSLKDSKRFYRALSVFETDFSMMATVFRSYSRLELKAKFKKEVKKNWNLVEECLRNRQPFDPTVFSSESDTESEIDKKTEKKRANKKKEQGKTKEKKVERKKMTATRRRKVGKHVIFNRGYYADSEEDADDPLAQTIGIDKEKFPMKDVGSTYEAGQVSNGISSSVKNMSVDEFVASSGFV